MDSQAINKLIILVAVVMIARSDPNESLTRRYVDRYFSHGISPFEIVSLHSKERAG